MPKSKLIFYISLTVFCLCLFFFGIYNLIFKKANPKITTLPENKPLVETPKETTMEAPKLNLAPISALTDEAILAPIITTDKSFLRYYSKNTGQVYQIDFNGNGKKIISPTLIPGLVFALWSPDKTKVITKIINKEKTNFYYYNYTAQQNTSLNSNLASVVWQDSSISIFYEYTNANKKSTLNISDPDGLNWKKITDFDSPNNTIIPIPKNNLIASWNKPDAFSQTSLKQISPIDGTKKELFKNFYGADYLWNNNGTKVLISNSNAKGGTKIQISLINSNGGELRNLDTPTLVSKCVWLNDNKNIICALPGEIPDNAIMPNDYIQKKFHTADTFWKINTLTGEKSRIIEPEKINQKYDATKLFLNVDESILFFINRNDGKLYRITL